MFQTIPGPNTTQERNQIDIPSRVHQALLRTSVPDPFQVRTPSHNPICDPDVRDWPPYSLPNSSCLLYYNLYSRELHADEGLPKTFRVSWAAALKGS